MLIEKITLTGVDESTDVDRLIQIANEFPFVEFGFLYTTTPEGRNRYPRRQWLEAVLPKLTNTIALHICGSNARKELSEGRLSALTKFANRVQVNGVIKIDEINELAAQVNILLTQHTAKNRTLLETTHLKNHCVLVDDSGGRGISPSVWTSPLTSKYVGFAGGLGPDNLATELVKIQSIAKNGAWIDMEGKLRTDDFFDLDKAQMCADIFNRCMQS